MYMSEIERFKKASILGVWILSLMMLVTSTALAKSLCPNGEHWVDSHHRRAYTRYDGVHVKATRVQSHCRKNPRGYKRWNKKLSNKRPQIWGYKREKSKKWTVEEVERFFDAIAVLPDQLLNLSKVKIYRMLQSRTAKNPATTNPPQNDVTLYDLAFVHEESLAQIISHELSHILFESLTAEEKNIFAEKAGWSRKNIMGKEYYFPKKNKVNIKADSIDSVEEDFANHIELFLFTPRVVRAKSKDAYDWIQDKFGKEFKIKEGP